MFLLRLFLRYLYAPTFFISFISLAIYIVASDINHIWLIALVLIAILTSLIAEHILPYEPVWNDAIGDVKRDILHALVNEGSIIISICLLPFISNLIPNLGHWPSDLELWQQLVLAVIIADFGITITHYASHKNQTLWKFHAVHHSVKRMYGFNGLMKHPIHQTVEMVIGTLPLIFFGLTPEVATLLSYAIIIQLLLQHSNVDIRVGRLIYIWAIAQGHRHHHTAHANKGDVNFGLFTMIWDHLLNTFVAHQSQPKKGEIGLANQQCYPVSYISQFLKPFK